MDQISSRSEGRILQILREQGESSSAELARLAGLGKATTSRAVQALRARGLIEETGAAFRRAPAGRAGRTLRIRPESAVYLGLAIVHQAVRAVVADAAKQVLATSAHPIAHPEGGLPDVRSVIRVALAALRESACDLRLLQGVGIAIAAPVDPATGQIGNSVMVPEWTGSNPQKLFSEAMGLRVALDNDANCAALAELLWGDLPPGADAVILRLDSGVGGAVILGGQVVHGLSGRAGDYGHITFDRHGPQCRCGNTGCFQHYLSIPAVEDHLRRLHGTANLEDACQRLERGDAGLRATVVEVGTVAGALAAVVARSVDPAHILFGGGLIALGDPFLEGARTHLRKVNPAAADLRFASAATILKDGDLRDEPALGAIGLLLRRGRD